MSQGVPRNAFHRFLYPFQLPFYYHLLSLSLLLRTVQGIKMRAQNVASVAGTGALILAVSAGAEQGVFQVS
jgi:hypothetical protein